MTIVVEELKIHVTILQEKRLFMMMEMLNSLKKVSLTTIKTG
jgi:hypothetical protein